MTSTKFDYINSYIIKQLDDEIRELKEKMKNLENRMRELEVSNFYGSVKSGRSQYDQ
jgi:hypothetical protein